jgi:hypothetical protein
LRKEKINCAKLEKEIEKEIEKANYCERDEDCIVAYFDCPFGCGSFINKNEKERLWKMVNKYRKYGLKRICPLCVYECMGYSGELACINKKCLPKQKEVTITTDKREYEQGEEVKVIIKNFLEEPIVLIKFPFVFFEKFKKGEWIEVKGKQERCLLEPMLKIKVPLSRIVKDNYEYTWLAKIKTKCDKDGKPIYENVPRGLYRAKTTFLPESVYLKKGAKNRQKEKTIYSNEFTIK